MELVQKPTLSLPQAVRLVLANLTNFSGRSRRSEYWWFMLPYYIVVLLVSTILTNFMSTLAVSIVQNVLVFFVFGVTVRRLHDCGHSEWWFIINWVLSFITGTWLQLTPSYTEMMAHPTPEVVVAFFTSPAFIASCLVNLLGLIIFVFTLIDGTKGDNQYGPSPKYSYLDSETAQTI